MIYMHVNGEDRARGALSIYAGIYGTTSSYIGPTQLLTLLIYSLALLLTHFTGYALTYALPCYLLSG